MPKTPETDYAAPAAISPNGTEPVSETQEVIYDPTNLANIRSKKGLKGLNSMPSRVPITTRPENGEFFRVRPGEEFTADIDLLVTTSTSNSSDRQAFYVITDEARVPVERFIKCCHVRVGINRQKVLFLWVRPVSENTYTESCWKAQAKAEKSWVTLESDNDLKEYKVHWAEDDLEWGDPKWPDITLQEAITQAFQGRIITSVDDPVVLKLRGKGND